MSFQALPGDPDEFLPRHISGRVVADPYATRSSKPVRVDSHVVSAAADEVVIDLVAIEAEEAELATGVARAAEVIAATAAERHLVDVEPEGSR